MSDEVKGTGVLQVEEAQDAANLPFNGHFEQSFGVGSPRSIARRKGWESK